MLGAEGFGDLRTIEPNLPQSPIGIEAMHIAELLTRTELVGFDRQKPGPPGGATPQAVVFLPLPVVADVTEVDEFPPSAHDSVRMIFLIQHHNLLPALDASCFKRLLAIFHGESPCCPMQLCHQTYFFATFTCSVCTMFLHT